MRQAVKTENSGTATTYLNPEFLHDAISATPRPSRHISKFPLHQLYIPLQLGFLLMLSWISFAHTLSATCSPDLPPSKHILLGEPDLRNPVGHIGGRSSCTRYVLVCPPVSNSQVFDFMRS